MKGNVIALLEDPVQITDYLNAFGEITGRLIAVSYTHLGRDGESGNGDPGTGGRGIDHPA